MRLRAFISTKDLRDRIALIAAAAIALVFIATFTRSLVGALRPLGCVHRQLQAGRRDEPGFGASRGRSLERRRNRDDGCGTLV